MSWRAYMVIALIWGLGLLPRMGIAQLPFVALGDQYNPISLPGDLELHDVVEDDKGMLYVATDQGLFRYDGSTFEQLDHTCGIINDTRVGDLLWDSTQHTLWLCSDEGLLAYHATHDQFELFQHDPEDPTSISFNEVKVLLKDQKGQFWIGTDGGGLNLMDQETGTFQRFQFDPTDSLSLTHNNVISLGEAADGMIWIGTWHGLNSLDPENGEVRRYLDGLEWDAVNHIWAVVEARPGVLWLAMGYGYEFDTRTYQETAMPQLVAEQTQGAPTNRIIKDEGGTLWLCGEFGVIQYDPDGQIAHDKLAAINPDEKTVRRVFIDANQNIWALTTSGLYVKNPYRKPFQTLSHDSRNNFALFLKGDTHNFENPDGSLTRLDLASSEPYSQTFEMPSKGGNRAGQLREIREVNGELLMVHTHTLTRARSDFSQLQTIQLDYTGMDPDAEVNRCLEVDHLGHVWLGTILGLNHFELSDPQKTFFRYEHRPGNPKNIGYYHFTQQVLTDSKQDIWVASLGDGLKKFVPQDSSWVHFRSDPRDSTSILSNFINCIYESQKGDLWIGSKAGLSRLTNNETFINYAIGQGLTSNNVHSILEDVHGNLWLGTTNGLFVFYPDEERFHSFDREDGLPSNNFHMGSALAWRDQLLFGNDEELLIFNPDEIVYNPIHPHIRLTDILLDNEEIKDPSQSEAASNYTEQITLFPQNQKLTIHYQAIHFQNQEKCQYAYMLKNFDGDWNYVHDERVATYTNLPPGEYTFRVKASNNDGIWSHHIREIKVVVQPSFWLTPAAYLLYVVMVMVIFGGGYALTLFFLAGRNRKKFERMQREESERMNQAKLRFFTNISHEIRTPLTMIVSPLEKAMATTSPPNSKVLTTMHRNGQRLLRLINQLLDFRKFESTHFQLSVSRGNLSQLLQDIAATYQFWIGEQKLTLTWDLPKASISSYFDFEKIENAIHNIFSNALKHTDQQGHIHLALRYTSAEEDAGHNQAVLSITDDGAGIAETELPRIFERFYMAEQNGKPGSGIGLALTKEIVELHKGSIEVKSEEGKGSTFTLTFKVGKKDFEANEWLLSEPSEEPLAGHLNGNHKVEPSLGEALVLIVEDTADIRDYLESELQASFCVLTASNGKEGVAMGIQHVPDLIITDYMMPEQDGIALTRQLKSHELTSHIPVLMLTARTSGKDVIQGLQSGADDYLTKPVNPLALQLKIQNQLASRRALRQKIENGNLHHETEDMARPLIDPFLEKVFATIDEHLAEPTFSVEQLGQLMGYSRSQLYRKVQGIVGKSIQQLITERRLQKAAHLLKNQGLRVSEASVEAGFNDSQYFSRVFKKEFGISPSQYC